MNRDLFLSILAMDSYNRGYGAGINKFGPNNAGQILELRNYEITVTVAAFPFLNYDCSVAISSAPLQRKRVRRSFTSPKIACNVGLRLPGYR